MNTPVTIIIPTYNNQQFLQPCLESLNKNFVTKNIYNVIVVNNGHPDSCNWIPKDNSMFTVVNTGKNVGWEGGLLEGLKHTDSPYIVFLNDDTYVPMQSRLWINKMLQHFRDPNVGAIGPSSNVVMGLQNMFYPVDAHVFNPKYLIGFCMMVRREALEKVGGIDETLPGGDDLDLSIRLRKTGYKLVVDRDVFIYHHGFKTGTRTRGDHTVNGGWNSIQMTEQVNFALIKKHGFKEWYETLYGSSAPEISYPSWGDIEGEVIKEYVIGETILDLGCGNNKTLPNAIGIDMVPKYAVVDTLAGDPESVADVQADVSQPLPFEKGSVDTVIARHILEHLLDTNKTIEQWLQVLKKGGRLIIAVPNEDLLLSIPMNMEHVHAFTQDTMKSILSKFPVKIIDIKPSGNHISFITVVERL